MTVRDKLTIGYRYLESVMLDHFIANKCYCT